MYALLFPALSDWATGAFQTGLAAVSDYLLSKKEVFRGFYFSGFYFSWFSSKASNSELLCSFSFLGGCFSFFAVVPNVMGQVTHSTPAKPGDPLSSIWLHLGTCFSLSRSSLARAACLLYVVLFWLQCVQCSDKCFSLGFKYTQIHFSLLYMNPVYPAARRHTGSLRFVQERHCWAPAAAGHLPRSSCEPKSWARTNPSLGGWLAWGLG